MDGILRKNDSSILSPVKNVGIKERMHIAMHGPRPMRRAISRSAIGSPPVMARSKSQRFGDRIFQNETNRVVRPDVVVNRRRQKQHLRAICSGKICHAIRYQNP